MPRSGSDASQNQKTLTVPTYKSWFPDEHLNATLKDAVFEGAIIKHCIRLSAIYRKIKLGDSNRKRTSALISSSISQFYNATIQCNIKFKKRTIGLRLRNSGLMQSMLSPYHLSKGYRNDCYDTEKFRVIVKPGFFKPPLPHFSSLHCDDRCEQYGTKWLPRIIKMAATDCEYEV